MIFRRVLVVLALALAFIQAIEAGLIKDIFQKITHTNNRTEDLVKESSPICGSGIFATPNEYSLSPEFIFITNKPSQSSPVNHQDHSIHQYESHQSHQHVKEVAKEFRFHEENVTLAELERRGFNPNGRTTFLIHGFTSGYPLQAWISAIVEAYTIDRQGPQAYGGYDTDSSRRRSESSRESRGKRLDHNLFVINWNYAARGIIYPRAVANIPIVASYVTKFINEKLLDEARVDPGKIELIGHSLGAHLAGFVGKNTRSRVGRIYGLDPAGPCFGTLSGPLYPSSRRLAPSDADEVITVHTNTALLGIDKPLGKYSIFVEGGSAQPGCKGGGVVKSISALTWDGEGFDTIACSHSRAPNLLTYRHDQSDPRDDCQLMAFECQDWESFLAGHCGLCSSDGYRSEQIVPAVDCKRLGLEWQYYSSETDANDQNYRPQREHDLDHNHGHYSRDQSTNRHRHSEVYRNSTASPESSERRESDSRSTKNLFIRTGDTQPYCIYHYQVILSLDEPFKGKKPSMSIILQDSNPDSGSDLREERRLEQNSLGNDAFGHKLNDRTYTHLLTSVKKLSKIDHATLLLRDGLPDARRYLREIHVNYMSHSDPEVRRRLSTRLCMVSNDSRHSTGTDSRATRFYFERCNRDNLGESHHHEIHHHQSDNHNSQSINSQPERNEHKFHEESYNLHRNYTNQSAPKYQNSDAHF